MYVDAHTHLNSDTFWTTFHDIIMSCIGAWIGWIVNIWYDIGSSHAAIDIANAYASHQEITLYATVGIHPAEISFGTITHVTQIDQKINELKHLYQKNKQVVRWIWECGIDAHYDGYHKTKSLQLSLFVKQCQLAKELHLPVIIHTRDDFEATWKVVQQFPTVAFYFHCRWYSVQEIRTLESRKAPTRVWFCGNITYKKAEHIRQSFLYAIQSNHIHCLLETDAPYLSPQWKRGEQNSPYNIIDIYAFCSQLTDIPREKLMSTLYQNRQTLYEPEDHWGDLTLL